MKMIQIRNVPDELHARLKARAAHQRMSLSDLLLDELERIAAKPTLDEWLERVQALEPVGGGAGADLVGDARAARDRDSDDLSRGR